MNMKKRTAVYARMVVQFVNGLFMSPPKGFMGAQQMMAPSFIQIKKGNPFTKTPR